MIEPWSPFYARLLKSILFDFGFLLLPLILILFLKKVQSIKKIAIFGIFFILVMGTKPFGDGVKSALSFFAKDDDLGGCNAEAVVLLTGGAINEMTPSIATQMRLQRALDLANSEALPLLISGGSVETTVPESEIAARFMEQKETNPKISVFLERDSKNTYQNGVYTGELLAKLQIRPDVILVTSPWHMLRSSLVFKHAGIKVCKASSLSEENGAPGVSFKNGVSSYSALNEVFGLLGYLLKGWL
jgi:uncharacterized SAM-binding protein YcdF (DUF218 family)